MAIKEFKFTSAKKIGLYTKQVHRVSKSDKCRCNNFVVRKNQTSRSIHHIGKTGLSNRFLEATKRFLVSAGFTKSRVQNKSESRDQYYCTYRISLFRIDSEILADPVSIHFLLSNLEMSSQSIRL